MASRVLETVKSRGKQHNPVTGSGGMLIGIVVGLGASQILSAVAHWPTLISLGSIIIAFFFSAAVGIFFGFYPAREAARLDPIEALRYE